MPKDDKTVRVAFSIPRSVAEAIQIEAKKNDRSVSAEVTRRLKKSLNQDSEQK